MKLIILSVLVVAACGFPMPQSSPILPFANNMRNTFLNFLNGTLGQINATNFLSFGFDKINTTTSRFHRMINRTALNVLADPMAELTCLATEQRAAVKACQNFTVNKCPSICVLKQAGAMDASGNVIPANLPSIITSTNLTAAQKTAARATLNNCISMNVSGTINTMQALFTNLTGIPLDQSCISAGMVSSCVLQALVMNGCAKVPRFSAMVQMPSELENAQRLTQESSSEEDEEDDEDDEDEEVTVAANAQMRSERLGGGFSESSPETDDEEEKIAKAQKQVGSLALYQAIGETEGEPSSEEGEELPGRVERDVHEYENQGKGSSGRSSDHKNGRGGGNGRGRGHKHGRNCTTTTTTSTTDVATEPDAVNTDP